MIIYSPIDGQAITHTIKSQPRHCFLMTRLGDPVPPMVKDMGKAIKDCCRERSYTVIDAQTKVTGRDFLIKIWRLVASSPLSVGILHEEIPQTTQANIFYELGVAQALGKETVIVKSPDSKIPSDFVRTEYIRFDDSFQTTFDQYLESILEQAEYYETVADQLDRNPVLALDYLKRAYLILGDNRLKKKAREVAKDGGFANRARNSVEQLASTF